jgi:hypothetical protein
MDSENMHAHFIKNSQKVQLLKADKYLTNKKLQLKNGKGKPILGTNFLVDILP